MNSVIHALLLPSSRRLFLALQERKIVTTYQLSSCLVTSQRNRVAVQMTGAHNRGLILSYLFAGTFVAFVHVHLFKLWPPSVLGCCQLCDVGRLVTKVHLS